MYAGKVLSVLTGDGMSNLSMPNNEKSKTLFRQEMLLAHNSQRLGSIRLNQPISTLVISTISLIVATSLITYITCGSVMRKARAAGLTIPSGGSVSITAPNAGLILHCLVAEGQQVNAGQRIFELSTERQSSSGELLL